jgi:hypothetical protein
MLCGVTPHSLLHNNKFTKQFTSSADAHFWFLDEVFSHSHRRMDESKSEATDDIVPLCLEALTKLFDLC